MVRKGKEIILNKNRGLLFVGISRYTHDYITFVPDGPDQYGAIIEANSNIG